MFSNDYDSYGFIDQTGKVVIKDYDKWAVGDAFVVPFVFFGFNEGLCPVFIPEKFGLSKHITEPLYDEIKELDDGEFLARSGDYYFVIDKNGKVIEGPVSDENLLYDIINK